MTQSAEKSHWDAPSLRWMLWLAYVTVWTTGLLMPLGDTSDLGETEQTLRFYVGKTLHVLGYAGMAALAGWLVMSFPSRLLLVFFVMSHATLTELLQHVFGSRTGALADVGLNHLGIGLGLLLTWRWWSEPT